MYVNFFHDGKNDWKNKYCQLSVLFRMTIICILCMDMKLIKHFVPLVGYANEVGEAFRALTPLWFVRSTYGVASAYVIADTYDKSTKMSKVNH